ncbi:MAG: SIS domain-containing protein [Eubacterium sp.]|nr:SIS domain-containing protein [Eubacterium sp.]
MDGYLDELIENLKNTRITSKEGDVTIQDLVEGFTDVKKRNGKVFFVGNGGSAAIAMHMTADFMKNGGIRTYSLYDSSVVTCLSNDYGYDDVFSRQLEFLASEGDLIVAISSSGKSQNIINAIEAARKNKAQVFTLTGFKENNSVRSMGDINVYVPIEKYGIVESIHNLILQEIVDVIMERDGVRL